MRTTGTRTDPEQDNRSRRGIDLEGPPPNRPNPPHTTPVESATATVSGHPRTRPGPGRPPARCPVGSRWEARRHRRHRRHRRKTIVVLVLSVVLSDALLPITRKTSRFGGAGGAGGLVRSRSFLGRHRRLVFRWRVGGAAGFRWRGRASHSRRGPGRAPVAPSPRHRTRGASVARAIGRGPPGGAVPPTRGAPPGLEGGARAPFTRLGGCLRMVGAPGAAAG